MQTQQLNDRTPQETMIDRVCKLAMAVVDLQARGLSVRAAEICAGDLGTVIEIDEPVNDAAISGFDTSLLTPLACTHAGTGAPVQHLKWTNVALDQYLLIPMLLGANATSYHCHFVPIQGSIL